MPSRASTSFLQRDHLWKIDYEFDECQCPHGLVPHFYDTSLLLVHYASNKCVNALTG